MYSILYTSCLLFRNTLKTQDLDQILKAHLCEVITKAVNFITLHSGDLNMCIILNWFKFFAAFTYLFVLILILHQV